MEPIMTPDCGQRYTENGIEFICSLDNHLRKPNDHHWIKDPNAVSRARLEASVEDHFRRVVKKLGGASFKLTIGGGAPDRLVMLPGGCVYFVELKSATGALRPDQRVWHYKASQLGTDVFTLSSKAQIDDWALDRAAEAEHREATA